MRGAALFLIEGCISRGTRLQASGFIFLTDLSGGGTMMFAAKGGKIFLAMNFLRARGGGLKGFWSQGPMPSPNF